MLRDKNKGKDEDKGVGGSGFGGLCISLFLLCWVVLCPVCTKRDVADSIHLCTSRADDTVGNGDDDGGDDVGDDAAADDGGGGVAVVDDGVDVVVGGGVGSIVHFCTKRDGAGSVTRVVVSLCQFKS